MTWITLLAMANGAAKMVAFVILAGISALTVAGVGVLVMAAIIGIVSNL
jgi:hypothetical protein